MNVYWTNDCNFYFLSIIFHHSIPSHHETWLKSHIHYMYAILVLQNSSVKVKLFIYSIGYALYNYSVYCKLISLLAL